LAYCVATNLKINFVDGLDDPKEPISDEIERVGERIWQVRAGQRVAT